MSICASLGWKSRASQEGAGLIDADTRFAELSARYRASLPIKRAGVELAWQALRAHTCSPATQEGLQRIVHRIAGSAPSYGYPAIGALAGKADEQLERLRKIGESDRSVMIGLDALSELEAVVIRLLAAFSAGVLENSAADPGP